MQATVLAIGAAVAIVAVAAAVTVGVIAGIRHFNRPSTTTATSAPEPDPAAAIAGPTSEACVRVRELETELVYGTLLEAQFERAGIDSRSVSASGLDIEAAEPERAFTDEELGLMEACRHATEAACAPLSAVVATQGAPTADTITDCSAASETLPQPPNIDLLIRYRCAGRLTDPCIDYGR